MDQPCELIRLLPHFLSVRHLLKRVALNPLPHELGHVFKESKVTALGLSRRVRTLHHLEQSDRRFVGNEGCRYQKIPCRITFTGFFAGARHGRYQFRPSL